MKVLVIVGLLFVYTQAQEPGERLAKTAAAIRDCVAEKKLDGAKILGIMTKGNLPDNDPEFRDFFACYYKKLGLVKSDGKLDEPLIRSLLPALIKQKFGDAVDAEKLSNEASKHCEGIKKDSDSIITAIRARNCVLVYVAEHK